MTILDGECEDKVVDEDKIWWKLGCQAQQENSAASLCKYCNGKLLYSNNPIPNHIKLLPNICIFKGIKHQRTQ